MFGFVDRLVLHLKEIFYVPSEDFHDCEVDTEKLKQAKSVSLLSTSVMASETKIETHGQADAVK